MPAYEFSADPRRVMLAAADAHGLYALYAQFGFEGVRAPEKYMVLGAH